MNYRLIIYVAIFIIVLCLIRKCNVSFTTEAFTNNSKNYNILHNASFENGNNITELSENRGSNQIVKINKNPSCVTSPYVLKQDGRIGKDISSYILSVNLKANQNYKFTLWAATEGGWDINNLVNIKLKQGHIYDCLSDSQLNVKQGKINSKTLGNLVWNQYQYNFFVPQNSDGKILIYVGCINATTSGTRYITDLNLTSLLTKDNNFKATLGLQTFLDASNKNTCGNGSLNWYDLSNEDQVYKWYQKPDWNSAGYFKTKGNSLIGPAANTLNIGLNNNYEFSFIIHSYGTSNIGHSEGEPRPSTLFVPGNQGTALELMIPNDNDYIYMKIGSETLQKTSKKINPQQNNIYTITHKNGVVDVWLNMEKFHTFTDVNKMYFGSNKLQINMNKLWDANLYSFMIYNKQLDKNSISYIIKYLKSKPVVTTPVNLEPQPTTSPTSTNPSSSREQKKKYSPIMGLRNPPLDDIPGISKKELEKYRDDCYRECLYYDDVTNCKKDIKSCKKYCKYNSKDQLCYLKPKERQTCPIAYMRNGNYYVYVPKDCEYVRKLGWGEMNYGPNKEKANRIYRMNFPECKVPKILRFDHVKNCPFIIEKNNPCKSYACRGVDWSKKDPNKMGMNNKCKRNISNYCMNNAELDPQCACWSKKYWKTPECQKFRRNFENPELFGFDINVFDIREHPDMKNYIRKDKIPCFNCDLEAPAPKQSALETRNWSNPNL